METLSAIFLGVLLLVVPGLVCIPSRIWRSGRISTTLAEVGTASAAFWALSLWIIPPGWFSLFALAVVGLATLWALRRRGREDIAWLLTRARRRRAGWLVAVVLACLVLRLGAAFVRPPPSAGDLTMHATATELIVHWNGLPPSQEPLLPFGRFGQNAPGFHAVAALVRLATGVPSYEAALVVGLLALLLVALALCALCAQLQGQGRERARVVGCFGVVFLLRNPQQIVCWGGLPTILSLALVLMSMAYVLRFVRHAQFDDAFRAGAMGAGALVTHTLPVVAALASLGALVLLALVFKPHAQSSRLLLGAAMATGTGLALAWPFVQVMPTAPPAWALQWAQAWFELEVRPVASALQPLLANLSGWSSILAELVLGAGYAVSYIGLLATLICGLWLVRSSRPWGLAAWASMTTLCVVQVLYYCGRQQVGPWWFTLYPSRVHLYLVIPAAVAAIWGVRQLARSQQLRIVAVAVVALACVIEPLGMGAVGTNDHGGGVVGAWWRTYSDRANADVRADDLSVMAYIANNLDDTAVIGNNDGDGGQLIPAVAHRKVTHPHYQSFFYRDELQAWRTSTEVTHVFVGANPRPGFSRRWTAEGLDRDDRFELVFAVGKARLYARADEARGELPSD